MSRTTCDKNLFFKGRPNDPRLGEWVCEWKENKIKEDSFVIWGCPSDKGVVLNRGRLGAAKGPQCIRKHLYRMTPPMDTQDQWELFDAGDLISQEEMLPMQVDCQKEVSRIGARGTLLAFGGGHDFAAPNFIGFMGAKRKLEPKIRFGLINVDPHLDVRELENGIPNSGTPFRQILESGFLNGDDFVEFGTRRNRNARQHFEYCQEKRVRIEALESLRRNGNVGKVFQKSLSLLSKRCGILGLTIDIDSCYEAEGSSAAPVIGFTAQELMGFAEMAGANLKVQFLEIAETAPSLDFNDRSCRIAAEIAYFFMASKTAARDLSKKNKKIKKKQEISEF